MISLEDILKFFKKIKYFLLVVLVVLVCFIVIPVLFNFLVMWDSGYAKGKASDWFVFYGNIVGGLIGGAFTYLALIITFKKEDKKEDTQKQEELNTKIKECILNNKTYLNSLDNKFRYIQNTLMVGNLAETMENFIDEGNCDFNEEQAMKGYSIDEVRYYYYLDEIIRITRLYEEQLKRDLIALSGNEFYHFQHRILLFNNSLNDSISIDERNNIDFELLSNFVIWKENFGYRSVLNNYQKENDDYYKKYIDIDIIGDHLTKVTLPHIKG